MVWSSPTRDYEYIFCCRDFRDLPGQADDLIKKMKEMTDKNEEANFEDDWKLLTVFIGLHDTCNACNDPVSLAIVVVVITVIIIALSFPLLSFVLLLLLSLLWLLLSSLWFCCCCYHQRHSHSRAFCCTNKYLSHPCFYQLLHIIYVASVL